MRSLSTAMSSPYSPQLEKSHAQHSHISINQSLKAKILNDTQYSVMTYRGEESNRVDTTTREWTTRGATQHSVATCMGNESIKEKIHV